MRVKAGLHPLWDNPVTGKTEKLDEWDEYGHPIPPLPTKEELEKEEAEWERWWSKIVRRVERFDRKGYNLMPGALVGEFLSGSLRFTYLLISSMTDFAMDLYFTEWEEGMVLEDAPQPAPIEPPPAPSSVPASRSPSPPTRSRIEVYVFVFRRFQSRITHIPQGLSPVNQLVTVFQIPFAPRSTNLTHIAPLQSAPSRVHRVVWLPRSPMFAPPLRLLHLPRVN
jgi:hypothetical protein